MSVLNVLLILLLLAFFGVIPAWPYSHAWGWGPSGLLFVLVVVLAIAAVSGGRLKA